MNIQVVHHQMDGLGFRILKGQVEGYLCELKRRPVRRGEGEVPARLRLYGAENISRAAALIFAFLSESAFAFAGILKKTQVRRIPSLFQEIGSQDRQAQKSGHVRHASFLVS